MNIKPLVCISLLMFACAGKPARVKTPNDPIMLPVTVRDGRLSGRDLSNAISNHLRLWKHIQELKKLGGFEK